MNWCRIFSINSMASSWHEVLVSFLFPFFLFLGRTSEQKTGGWELRNSLCQRWVCDWFIYNIRNFANSTAAFFVGCHNTKRGEVELHLSYWIAIKGYCWHSPGQGNKNQQRVARKTATTNWEVALPILWRWSAKNCAKRPTTEIWLVEYVCFPFFFTLLWK